MGVRDEIQELLCYWNRMDARERERNGIGLSGKGEKRPGVLAQPYTTGNRVRITDWEWTVAHTDREGLPGIRLLLYMYICYIYIYISLNSLLFQFQLSFTLIISLQHFRRYSLSIQLYNQG